MSDNKIITNKMALIAISNLAKYGRNNQVSIGELSKHLNISEENALKTTKRLEAKGYALVSEKLHAFFVVAITNDGQAMLRKWKKQDISWVTNPIIKLFSILLGTLITALTGFAIWYFGFSPSSTTLLPRTNENPMKFYYPEEQEMTLSTRWVVNDVGLMKEKFAESAPNPFYEAHFPDAQLVSLDGMWVYEFDVESAAKFSQANLTDLIIEYSREPIPNLIDFYENPHGLGGGIIREYNVTLGASGTGKIEYELIPAEPSENEDFDYLKFSPGERETIRINLELPVPGLYHITPTAIIIFRNQEFTHPLKSFDVVFPENYREWFTSDNGHGILASYPFTVIRSGEKITLGEMAVQSPPRPIIFETYIVEGQCKVFIIENQDISELFSEEMSYCAGKLRWSENGQNVIYEEISYLEDARIFSFDVNTAVMSDIGFVEPEEQTSITMEQLSFLETKCGQNFNSPNLSPKGNRIAVVIELSDDEVTNYSHSGQIIIMNTETLEIVEIVATKWCDSPNWSPTGEKLVFTCRTPNDDGLIHPDYPGDLWVADTMSGQAIMISHKSGLYNYFEWSKGEESVLVGGSGVWIFQTENTSSPYTIFEIPYGCHKCIFSPRQMP